MMIVSNPQESFDNQDAHEEYSCSMIRSIIKEEEILTDTSNDSDDELVKENFHLSTSQVDSDQGKAVENELDIHIKTSQLGPSPKKRHERRSELSKIFLAKSLLNLIIKNTEPTTKNVTLDDDLSSSDSDEDRERVPIITMTRVNKIILIDTKLRQETRVELPRLMIHDSTGTVDAISISPKKPIAIKTDKVESTALKSPQKLPYLEIKDKRTTLEFLQKPVAPEIAEECPVLKLLEIPPPPAKRKRGRPAKHCQTLSIVKTTEEGAALQLPLIPLPSDPVDESTILQPSLTDPPQKRKRGRPRKSETIVQNELFPIRRNSKRISSKPLSQSLENSPSPKRIKIKRKKYHRSYPETYVRDPDPLKLMEFHCSACQKNYPRVPYTRRPTNCETCGHTPLSWLCGKCGRIDDSWFRAYRHLMSKCVDRKRYVCDHCGLYMRDKGHLRKHIWELHMGLQDLKTKPTSGPQCARCNKFFSAHYNLMQHMQRCGTEATHACPNCPFRSKTKGDLDKHRWRKHAEIYGGLKFVCDACGKKYGREDALKKHKSHFCGKESKYRCTWCKKEFRFKRYLVEHITIKGC